MDEIRLQLLRDVVKVKAVIVLNNKTVVYFFCSAGEVGVEVVGGRGRVCRHTNTETDTD